MTYAPPGRVVLGERTRQLLGDLADVIPLGTPVLKGKAVPVAVYELRAMHDERLRPAIGKAGDPLPRS